MLDYAAALCQKHGIDAAVVNAHWLPEQVEAWAEAHAMDLKVSRELPDILGTGGGLKRAAPWLDEGFVVVNGDILCDVDLAALLDALAKHDALAAMALRVPDAGQSYGVVAADQDAIVVDLVGLGTAEPHGEVDRSTHFTGVHALRRSLLESLPQGESCIVRQGYAPRIADRVVASIRHSGTWFDVGTPQAYLQANLLAVSRELSLPLDPFAHASTEDYSAHTRGDVWIGPGAVLEPGCTVGPRAIIGAGAIVERGATVVDSVVWDGCRVPAEASLKGAIVYDQGTLLPGMDS
jgi:mannose-1-phosphate guanylyltransferase